MLDLILFCVLLKIRLVSLADPEHNDPEVTRSVCPDHEKTALSDSVFYLLTIVMHILTWFVFLIVFIFYFWTRTTVRRLVNLIVFVNFICIGSDY